MKVSEYKDSSFLKKYNKGPIFHKFVGIPAVIEILKNVKNTKILDLGCGSGDFSCLLAEKGATVAGIDVSQKWIDICKKEHANVKNLEFYKVDGSNLKKFQSNTFDYVVINMVFLNISTKERVQKVFMEVSRVLKETGELIFTDLNPVSIMIPKNKLREYTYLPGFSYFKEGSNYKLKVMITNGSKIEFSNKHWELEAYTRYLNKAKMYIHRIIEPQPIKNAPFIPKNYEIPERIIFVCRKF